MMLKQIPLALLLLWLGGCSVAPRSIVEPAPRAGQATQPQDQGRYQYPDNSRYGRPVQQSTPATGSSSPAPESVRRAPVAIAYSDSKTGVSAADALLREGRTYHSRGQYANAANNFERGIRMAPRSPALYLALARTRLALNEYNSAVQMANRALSLLPREGWGVSDARADAWNIIADSKEAAGDRQGAATARAKAKEYW